MSQQYIKILTQDLLHRKYQWKLGMNELNEPLEHKYRYGGFYVCDIKEFFRWIPIYPNMAWVSYVTIPDDANKIVMERKIKTDKVILNGPLIPLIEFIDIAVKNGADINAMNLWGEIVLLAAVKSRSE